MTTTKFPTNLFDFDFKDEKFRNETSARIEAEIFEERYERLRKMARRALDEDRMPTYFRILDSLEICENLIACEPAPTPSAYGIPEIKLSYVRDPTKIQPQAKGSNDTARIFRETFEPGEIGMQEYFKVLYLDMRNKVLGVHTVSKGGMNCTIVDPKIIFAGALLAHARAIILCHNHPSGNTKPSPQDDTLTRKLKEGGKLLEIAVLDHIIITDDSYYSYADEGRM